MRARHGENALLRRNLADDVDHRQMPDHPRRAEREPEDCADVVFELARLCALDRPVTGVVHAWRHLVRNELAVLQEELDREDTNVVEGGEDALGVPLGAFLELRSPGIALRDREAKDPFAM